MTDTLRLLTGDDAGGLLAAAVETAGGRLVTWRAKQVDHRPGTGTTVAYAARVAWADREQEETLAASAGIATDCEHPGVLLLSDGATDVAVWRYPFDPGLPALTLACDLPAVHALLLDLGLADPASSPGDVELLTRAYRPRRRAVVEARFPARDGGTGRAFLKVARPDRVADLHRRHQLLVDAGVPVPRPLGWNDDGLLVLTALPGKGLRRQLRARGAAAVDAGDLLGVLNALPAELLEMPRRASWTDGAEHYARVIGAAVPDEAERAAALARAVRDGLAAQDEPVVPVHGDFYEAQLFADGGHLTGVLDVDSAGPGHRADDLACLLAHVEVLAQIHTADADRLREAVAGWLPVMEADPATDPTALRLRTAGALLSLATGPHRVQQSGWQEATGRRLDLVERWLAHAGS
ncbi:MAG: aminoglycoside phosphotransferase family protein [Actinomycetes bacterium]